MWPEFKKPEPKPVGTFHLAEDVEYTQHYETASWWKKHAVKAGSYPIVKSTDHGTNYWYLVRLPSVVGNSAFGRNRYEANRDKGQSGTYHLQFDAYQVANFVGEGKVTLNEDWEVETVGKYGPECGKLAEKPIVRVKPAGSPFQG